MEIEQQDIIVQKTTQGDYIEESGTLERKKTRETEYCSIISLSDSDEDKEEGDMNQCQWNLQIVSSHQICDDITSYSHQKTPFNCFSSSENSISHNSETFALAIQEIENNTFYQQQEITKKQQHLSNIGSQTFFVEECPQDEIQENKIQKICEYFKNQGNIPLQKYNTLLKLNNLPKNREKIWKFSQSVSYQKNKNHDGASKKPFKDVFVNLIQSYTDSTEQTLKIIQEALNQVLPTLIFFQSIQGLQYVFYGILVSVPKIIQEDPLKRIVRAFIYLNKKLNLQSLYSSGNYYYYGLAFKQIQQKAIILFPKLQLYISSHQNIFLMYYMQLMMYEMKNELIICKIFDLLLCYGLKIITTILLKILSEKEEEIVQSIKSVRNEQDQIKVDQNMRLYLVSDYFKEILQKKPENMNEQELISEKFMKFIE